MSFSQNFPNISPSLLMDFANSNTVDPRVTFTRASTATYFNSIGSLTTAAINSPRLDYDPTTLASQGLLIEEQRTNQCTYSADFTNAAWVASLATKTTGIADPFGGNTAATVTATGIAGSIQNAAATVSISTVYTVSCWMRRRTGTGAVGIRAVENANTTVAITSTWARYSVTVTATQTIGRVGVFVQTIGDEIDMCGFQLEAGAFQTSYIPTTTAAVTRSADVASVNTLSPWFNATAGTLYAEFNIPNALAIASSPRVFALLGSGGAAVDDLPLFVVQSSGKAASFNAFIGGVNVGRVDATPSFVANTVIKAAGCYAANDRAVTANGVAPTTSTTAYTIPTITIARLGAQDGSGINSINGYIRRIAYYPRRLSDANLQALTS